MKKQLFFTLLTSVLVFGCASNEQTEQQSSETPVQAEESSDAPVLDNYIQTVGSPDILFAEQEHDFGEVIKGDKVPYTFEFVNSGDAPLLITDARGSCGCTIPFYNEEPIKPGEKGKIDVTVDTGRKTAGKSFTVFVTVNSNGKNEEVKLKLSGVPIEK